MAFRHALALVSLLLISVAIGLWAAPRLREASFHVRGPQAPARPPAYPRSGQARVVDGDSHENAGTSVRLHGMDAFEYDQLCGSSSCGREATRALEALISGREVGCEPVDTDRYGRTVARCFTNGVDLGRAMVRAGHAVAYVRYSTAYLGDERRARRERVGAWAHQVEEPDSWRRRQRSTDARP